MAIIKMRPPKAGKAVALRFLIDYMMNYEKTNQDWVYGKNCNPETAFDEMMLTKELWNKTDGRQYCHFIQSFSPKDNITPVLAHEIGKRLIDEFRKFNGFEIVMVTHTDKGHLHNHFAINSVNAETGLNGNRLPRIYMLLKNIQTGCAVNIIWLKLHWAAAGKIKAMASGKTAGMVQAGRRYLKLIYGNACPTVRAKCRSSTR